MTKQSNAYWYTADDMVTIGNRVLEQAGLSEKEVREQFFGQLIKDNILKYCKNHLELLNAGKPCFVAYNVGVTSKYISESDKASGSHWIALCLVKIEDHVKLFYKDSLGSYHGDVQQELKDAFTEAFNSSNVENINFDSELDFIVHSGSEQKDGSSCGPMTLKNLQIIAKYIKGHNTELLVRIFTNLPFCKQEDVEELKWEFNQIKIKGIEESLELNKKGEQLLNEGNLEEALNCFNQAIILNPNNDSSNINQAKTFNKIGESLQATNQSKALQYFEEATRIILKILDGEKDRQSKLAVGINHIDKLKYDDFSAETSRDVSKKILSKLHDDFWKDQREELYKPWVRYFDIVMKIGAKSGTSELVKQILFKDVKYIDWRIAKKALDIQVVLKDLFEEEKFQIKPQSLFKPILNEIEKAFEYLLWKDETASTTKLAISTLEKLERYFSNPNLDDKFIKNLSQAIISGRFNKKFDKNDHTFSTIIMGEDGGMYLLLNNYDDHSQPLINDVSLDDYMQNKMHNKKKGKQIVEQIEIGKGGFGTVRLALSLLDSKAKPGDIICVKKSRSFEKLQKENKGYLTRNPLTQIIDTTLGDYFTNDAENTIYAPEVFDMALITSKKVDDEHRKGYVMMELFPQNTATKMFEDTKYQEWEYQRPYLLDVFGKVRDLLQQNVAMTDLKPDNTLYDKDTRKATIIDIGGTVKLHNKDDITQFNTRKHVFQSTEGFRAPELQKALDEQKGVIDLNKALAFACGEIIRAITKDGTAILPEEYRSQVKGLIDILTKENLEDRILIEDAIKKVESIGNDSYKEKIIFTHYISKIKERLKNNKSSIGINEDIEKLINNQDIRKLVSNEDIESTESLYIDIDVAKLNPHRYAGLNTEDLSNRIDSFWNGQNEVMLLLGVAGSGKSITLQLKFIEAISKWKVGDSLPIYFNLASNIDLIKIIESLNKELGTNLDLNGFKNTNVHLYIDSFDEGIGIITRRDTLINSYIKKLENPKAKILVSCKTDYLPNDTDYSWFMPESKQLEVCYIAPIYYSGKQSLEGCVERYVTWLNKHNKTDKDAKYYLDQINQLNIKQFIDTGFMFEIIMQSIPSLSSITKENISRQDIYDNYVEVRTEKSKEIQKLNEKQENRIVKLLSAVFDADKTDLNMDQLLKELGKYVAIHLHLQNKFLINNDSELFKVLEYKSTTLFNQQALYFILKLLPLKIVTKNSGSKFQIKQEVEVMFTHNIIKNYYLFEAIKDEIERSKKSEILSNKNIVNDVELVKLIADNLVYNEKLQIFLRESIDVTKQDKSVKAVTLAANSITLLVASQYSFSGEDLSNISIKGANIRNGIFQYVDFSNADLTEVNLTNTNLVGAKFIGTNMTDIKLSIHPDLEHNAPVYCLSYSPDGKYLASGSNDKIVRIWDAKNGKLLQNLEGHTWYIKCIRYSPDGKYLASGSTDNTVKIWNAKDGRLLQNLEGHTRYGVEYISYSHDGKQLASGSCYMNPILEIWNVENPENDKNDRLVQNLKEHTCISYSPDGKYFSSGSLDKTVIIWDIENSKLFQTLTGHTSGVKCISYSPDGKYLASSEAHTIKIWNAENGNLLQNLNEQTDVVRDIRYSPDGQYLAVSSVIDNTVKIWNAINGKLLHNLEKHMYVVTCISYSPDGQYLASGFQDNIVKIWDAKNGSLLKTLITHLGRVECISYSPDGKYLASGYSDLPRVKIWNIKDYMLLQNIAGHSTNVIRCLSYSPDGKYLASGSEDCTVKIWNVEDGRLLKDFKEHTNIVYCLSYSPDGKYLASGSYDKTVKIWDVENSRLLKEIREHTDIVKCISYSPDGQYLASGSQDNIVKIWDIKNGRLQNLKGHAWSIECISYSPDGQYLASGSYDHTVKIWNVEDGRLLYNLKKHTYAVECISYSHDGKYLTSCSCDKTVRIWNATNGKLLKTLEGYSNGPQRVSYSPDGQYLALCSNDNTVKVWYIKDCYGVKFFSLLKNLEESTTSGRCISYSPDGQYLASGSSAIKIWDIKNGRLLKHLTGHIAEISCISYSPDGQYLASGSDDATLKIWEKRTNPQSKKVVWHLIKEISASESPLLVEDVTIENTVISTKNQRVFEQKGAKVANNIINDRDFVNVHDNESAISAIIDYKTSYDKLLGDRLKYILGIPDAKLVSFYSDSGLPQELLGAEAYQ